MAANQNPLVHVDLFGNTQTEPSVSGLMLVQTKEPVGPGVFNDLYLLAAFRSGKPGVLNRFRKLSALESMHDPDRNEDRGVALARAAKATFADSDVFGAADIVTQRVDPATLSTAYLKAGAVNLLKVETADYGSHTERTKIQVDPGTTAATKKVTVYDDVRSFVGDDLGPLLSGVQYTGDASTATLSILSTTGKIDYSAAVQPADADTLTVTSDSGSKTFEFESAGGVGPGNVSVTIGATYNATFAALATAIAAQFPNLTVDNDTTNDIITVTGTEHGVAIVEGTDTNNAFVVSHTPGSAFLLTTLAGDQTDGSDDLAIPLTLSSFRSIQLLAAYIEAQNGYTAQIADGANQFIDSSGLDPVTASDITAAKTLNGFNAAIADFLNSRTRGFVTATEVTRGEPDEDKVYQFTGGTTPAVTITDWQNALTVMESVQTGGIIVPDTDDASVLALISTWIDTERATGKWWRCYAGVAPGLSQTQRLTISGALDNPRLRLVCQRPAVFGTDGNLEYLHPTFLAAALAGGVAGNLPYNKTLTQKRLRYVGIHENDDLAKPNRAALLGGGYTVIKRDGTGIVVSLHVTNSHDPVRRMNRIASERDVAGEIDFRVQAAFRPFLGAWTTATISTRVVAVMQDVLSRMESQGAIIQSVDQHGTRIPAWQLGDPSHTFLSGVLSIFYSIYLAGELDYIDLLGNAEYQPVIGVGGSGLQQLSITITT